MKTNSVSTACLMALFIIFSMSSCTKKDDSNGLSDDIKNFVPQYIIDSMQSWGLKINEGKTPPSINGIYLFSPDYCTFDNSGYNREGSYFDSYKYWFYSQDNKALTVKLNSKNLQATDTASGAGAFLSGKDNYFTAFIEVNGLSEGVSYTRIDFYSGQITSLGVADFQTAIYMKSKGPDPSNKLISVGSSRIFSDNDNISDLSDTYRIVQTKENEKTMGGSK